MCLIVLARHGHPRYPLVVVANRDEFHGRPAQEAHWWADPSGVLAGRDLQAGGTWMGVDRRGRFAAVTNYREGVRDPAPRSRGELTLDFLRAPVAPRPYLQGIASRASLYGGFSLLAGDVEQMFYFSNRGQQVQAVGDGIHTLSNHVLNTPWPKAELARLKLGHALLAPQLDVVDLLAVLGDRQPFEDHELPTTGVGIELERVLSPPFILSAEYGTRCTSVFLVDVEGRCTYAERSFIPNGKSTGLVLHEFELPVGGSRTGC